MLRHKQLSQLSRCSGEFAMLQQYLGYAKASDAGSADSKLQLMMKSLTPQEVKKVEMTPEDLAEAAQRFVACLFIALAPIIHLIISAYILLIQLCRAKEYSRLRMKEEREWQASLSTKLKLKQAALAALPDELRAAALVPDNTPFPSNRWVWTETPPHMEDSGQAKAKKQLGTKKTIGTKRR